MAGRAGVAKPDQGTGDKIKTERQGAQDQESLTSGEPGSIIDMDQLRAYLLIKRKTLIEELGHLEDLLGLRRTVEKRR